MKQNIQFQRSSRHTVSDPAENCDMIETSLRRSLYLMWRMKSRFSHRFVQPPFYPSFSPVFSFLFFYCVRYWNIVIWMENSRTRFIYGTNEAVYWLAVRRSAIFFHWCQCRCHLLQGQALSTDERFMLYAFREILFAIDFTFDSYVWLLSL